MKTINKKTVYFIEDNEFFSYGTEIHLKDHLVKHQIINFTTAEECIKRIEREDDMPACIILDYYLPGMDGLIALGELKRLLPKTPVVMLTKEKSTSIGVKCIKMGAADFIVKDPRALPQLSKVIQSFL